MKLTFSRLADERVEEAFSVLQLVGQWLESKGRRQRISKTPFESYSRWQSENANFVVMHGSEIVGLVTIRKESLDDWPAWSSLGSVQMIRALATHPEHRGRGVGRFAIQESVKLVETREGIYLDCVSDSLPDYYAKFGFVSLGQQIKEYPDGETYKITLMRLVANPIVTS